MWKLRRTVLQSLYFSLLCFVLFFVFSLIAIVIGNKNVDAAAISEVQFWEVNLFILLLAGLLGLIIGFVVYFSNAYSKKIEQKAGILNLNISHYLVPLVENRDREVGYSEVRDIIDSQKLTFPRKLIGFFSDHKIFDDKGCLSEGGFRKLKRLAFAA